MKRIIIVFGIISMTFFAEAKDENTCVRSYAQHVQYIENRYSDALASCAFGAALNWVGMDPIGGISDMDCANDATWDYNYSLDFAGGQFLACLGVA